MTTTEYPLGRIRTVLETRREQLQAIIDTGVRRPKPPRGDKILPSDNRFVRALARGIARMRFRRTNRPAIEIQQRAEERVLLADQIVKQEYTSNVEAARQAESDIKDIQLAMKIVEALSIQGRNRLPVAGALDWKSAIHALTYSAQALVDTGPLPPWFPGEDIFEVPTQILANGDFEGGLSIVCAESRTRYNDPDPSFLEAVLDERGHGILKATFQSFTGFLLFYGQDGAADIALQRGKIGEYPCIWHRAPQGTDIFAIHNFRPAQNA